MGRGFTDDRWWLTRNISTGCWGKCRRRTHPGERLYLPPVTDCRHHLFLRGTYDHENPFLFDESTVCIRIMEVFAVDNEKNILHLFLIC